LKYKIIAGIILFSLICIILVEADTVYKQITEQTCDSCSSCPEGFSCFSFPEIGRRCAKPFPCDYYQCPINNKCSIATSIIATYCPDGRQVGGVSSINCECTGPDCPTSDDDGNLVGYDVATGIITITPSGKKSSSTISLGESVPGSGGYIRIISSNKVPAKYSEELVVENSILTF
jgi:hypothetical protein